MITPRNAWEFRSHIRSIEDMWGAIDMAIASTSTHADLASILWTLREDLLMHTAQLSLLVDEVEEAEGHKRKR